MNHPRLSRASAIYTIAVIGFIYTLHLVIPMYSNSNFLSLYASEQTVGFIYMLGAALSILGFLFIPTVIRRYGNYATSVGLITLQMALFVGIIQSDDPIIVSALFVLQSAVVALISLTLDIFLEVYTDGPHTGTIRGFYNTALNASWIIAPLIGSMLINGTDNYRHTYVAGLAMLVPLVYLIYRNFPRFKDPNYTHLSPWQLFNRISKNKNWVALFCANIILQIFYAWMTVYCPLYLHNDLGFGWEDIGIILVVMLLPFALIQYELGKLSDGKYGEKFFMILGFSIMGLSTIALSFITIRSVAVWAIALFVTRIGAAAAEMMMEAYFFKTVSPRDSAVLGSFRITRPLSYFIAPLLMGFGLMFATHQYMFAVVGIFTLLGIYPALKIKDTV